MKKATRISFLLLATAIVVAATYNLYPQTQLPQGAVIDSIVVLKSERKLIAYAQGSMLKTYKVALGRNPMGHKETEGDGKTPEGSYHISGKTTKSRFHKNLAVSYPNQAAANQRRKPPGGNIKIHGLQNGLGFIGRLQALSDWTAGCMAVTDEEIDELYRCTKVGSPITILP